MGHLGPKVCGRAELSSRLSVLGAAEAAAHEEDLNTSASPALQRLQQLDTKRDADLFAIIRGCGFTELPAADPHVAMQERVKDKATQLVAQQDAKAVRTLFPHHTIPSSLYF